MPKKVFVCTVCDILKDCNEKKEIIDNVNNIIFNSKTEKDIEGLFNNIDINNKTLPSCHYIKKHRDNCLKDFKPLENNKKDDFKDKQNTSFIIPDDFINSSAYEQYNKLKDMFLQLLYKETYKTLTSDRINKDNISNIKNLYELSFNHQINIGDIVIGNNQQELTDNILEMIRKTLSGTMINRKELLDIMKFIKPEEYNFSTNDNNLQRFTLNFNKKDERNNIEPE